MCKNTISFTVLMQKKKLFAVVPHKFTFDDITLDDIFIVVWHFPMQG
jgi:hypothetical protein